MGTWIEPCPCCRTAGESLAVSDWKPLTGVMEDGVDCFYWTMGRMNIKFGKVLWMERKELIFEMIKRDQGRITERNVKVKAVRLKDDPCSNMLDGSKEQGCIHHTQKKRAGIKTWGGESYRVSFSHAVRQDQPCLERQGIFNSSFSLKTQSSFPEWKLWKMWGGVVLVRWVTAMRCCCLQKW